MRPNATALTGQKTGAIKGFLLAVPDSFMPLRPLALIATFLLCLVPYPALAASVPPGFSAGLAGPLLTYVHLLGLLGLGLWLDMQGKGVPGTGAGLAIVAGIIAGFLVRFGVQVPYVALGLEASLILFGLLLALTLTLPGLLGLALAGVAGVLHGLSLGQWGGPVTGNPLFWPGMVTGCMLLIAAGVGLSAVLYPLGTGKASRGAGIIIALVGLLMLVNVIR